MNTFMGEGRREMGRFFGGRGEGVLHSLIWYYDAMILVGVGDVVVSGMEREGVGRLVGGRRVNLD